MDVLDGIEVELNKRGIKNIRISGETPTEKRKALVDYFQNDPVSPFPFRFSSSSLFSSLAFFW